MRRIEDCVSLVIKETYSKRKLDKMYIYFSMYIYRLLLDKYKILPNEIENACILIDFYDYTSHKPGFLEKNGYSLKTDYIVSIIKQQKNETDDDYLKRIIQHHDSWVCSIVWAKYYTLYKHYNALDKYDLSEKYRILSLRLLKHCK